MGFSFRCFSRCVVVALVLTGGAVSVGCRLCGVQSSNEPASPEGAVESVLPEGWPWTLLRLRDRRVLALDANLDEELLTSQGVVSTHAFQVERPDLWLIVFEFANQPAAMAAQTALVRWCTDNGRPHSPQATFNGAYMLVVGFPSEETPSPEMTEAALGYLSAFAGEE